MAEKISQGTRRRHGRFWSTFSRFKKNKAAMVGLILFIIEILIAILAPLLAPYGYAEMNFAEMLQGPSLKHWMGTDDMGRDILSRILYGARSSMSMGIIAVIVSTGVGVVIGAIAGYFGGATDNIIMRLLDIIQAIPSILLCIVVSTVLGSGYINTVIALSIGRIPNVCRLMRGSILNIRKMEYLESAESINCSKFRIIFSHILPNSFSPQIVSGTMGVATTISLAAMLSYIGLGVQPPEAEWGAMLSAARDFMRVYPHTILFPGIAIMVTVLALNLMGDGLRDALDPKLRD